MTTPEDNEVLELIYQALLKRWPETRIEPSLDRIAALCDALGSPQLSYPTIHIAGTNGKTTTSRMIDSLFRQLGYRTGRFTSPHLESFLERISINGAPIPAEGLIATYNDIALYLDLIDSRQPHPISFFEAMTALAFVAFAEFPVDIGVIEAGMGGEWDATNVVQSQVAVITPIGLDHQEYLGNTITEIARTKSGIIKPESHVVMAAQPAEAATVLTAKVVERAAIPYREGIEFSVAKRSLAVGGQLVTINGVHGVYEDIFIPLYGSHQAGNAAVALAAVEAFAGVKVDDELVRQAFAAVDSPGRLEILYRIVAILGDKDVRGILTELEPVIDRVVVTQNSSDRAMSTDKLYELAVEIFGIDRTYREDNLRSAITYSMEQVTLLNQVSDGVSAVIIAGSVVTAGESRAILRSIQGATE